MIDREARAKSYDDELRSEYQAYLDGCAALDIEPGYKDIVEYLEGV